MFRPTDVFHSIAQFVREVDFSTASAQPRLRAEWEPDALVGALMPVYSEIARRLSNNAYTSHGPT